MSRPRQYASLQAFLPAPIRVNTTERFGALVGAGIGILVTGLVSRWLAGHASVPLAPWLIAPLGASAVLVFAVPSSPLAQPWAVIGGNTLSALVGIACAHWIADPALASAAAVGLAIAVMFSLRYLHPPGGATALLVVLIHATNFEFALFPVFGNSLLLALAGVLYNSLIGRRYPHAQATPARAPTLSERFSEADLDAAMAHYNEVLDVGRDDLTELLHRAELATCQRNLGELRCADIMSAAVVTVEFGTPLDEAWALMRERRIKTLLVIDKARHVVGVLTSADFMRHAGLETRHGIGERLRALVARTGVHRRLGERGSERGLSAAIDAAAATHSGGAG